MVAITSRKLTVDSLAISVSEISARLKKLEDEVHADYQRRTMSKAAAEYLKRRITQPDKDFEDIVNEEPTQ